MGHPTWENTTRKFKANTIESFEKYYNKNRNDYYNFLKSPGVTDNINANTNVPKLQHAGLFPPSIHTKSLLSGEDTIVWPSERDRIYFDERLKRQTQDTIWLKNKNPFK